MRMDFAPNVSTVNLEKFKFAVVERLSPEWVRDIRAYEHTDFMTDQLVVELRSFVWSEDVGKEQFKYPADWWQAFKARWFPQWMLNKWPIKYTRVTLDVKATYPNFHPSLPNEQVVYQIIKSFYDDGPERE